jgi:hypothetical protein
MRGRLMNFTSQLYDYPPISQELIDRLTQDVDSFILRKESALPTSGETALAILSFNSGMKALLLHLETLRRKQQQGEDTNGSSRKQQSESRWKPSGSVS